MAILKPEEFVRRVDEVICRSLEDAGITHENTDPEEYSFHYYDALRSMSDPNWRENYPSRFCRQSLAANRRVI